MARDERLIRSLAQQQFTTALVETVTGLPLLPLVGISRYVLYKCMPLGTMDYSYLDLVDTVVQRGVPGQLAAILFTYNIF
jgi:hypothetical protein